MHQDDDTHERLNLAGHRVSTNWGSFGPTKQAGHEPGADTYYHRKAMIFSSFPPSLLPLTPEAGFVMVCVKQRRYPRWRFQGRIIKLTRPSP